ncbi:MAG: hypothetical protein KatS3mg051_1929 [Anaerolineae bacterium]|nr:MAG: hypothetical protein KatS3mg051_1929 [Anaerolineae bacterium]
MYLYEHDSSGRLVEVLAIDEHPHHVMYDSAGRTLATWQGAHLVNAIREVAYTRPHCIPSGDGWRRAGEAIGQDGRDLWRWERLWQPVCMPGSRKDGRR